MAESSLEPDFWLNADRSDEDDEVVDIEAGGGYRERLPWWPDSEF
jgi:hypothetical protein